MSEGFQEKPPGLLAPGPDYNAQLQGLAATHHNQYSQAQPFPHIVLDDFYPADILEQALAYFPPPSYPGWKQKDQNYQIKLGGLDIEQLADPLRYLLYQFNSRPLIEFLEKLTGIEGLVPDPFFHGGGLHQILTGGSLSVHADFNRHPTTHLRRRLNLLLYLNKDWKEEYNGQLELWDTEVRHCVVKIAPIFNRCVIFNTTSDSFHGHPNPLACPPTITRKSIALYYYTADITQQVLPEQEWTTLWQTNPGQEPLSTKIARLEAELDQSRHKLNLVSGQLFDVQAEVVQKQQTLAVAAAQEARLTHELAQVQNWALEMEQQLKVLNQPSKTSRPASGVGLKNLVSTIIRQARRILRKN